MAKRSAAKPRSVVVCGHTVTIKWHKPKEGQTVENWGIFHPDRNVIDLVDWPEWERILLHEVCHAVLHYSGHSNGLKNEEAIVTALEYGLSPLLRLR
jgi:hypothetical protein